MHPLQSPQPTTPQQIAEDRLRLIILMMAGDDHRGSTSPTDLDEAAAASVPAGGLQRDPLGGGRHIDLFGNDMKRDLQLAAEAGTVAGIGVSSLPSKSMMDV